MKKKISSFAVVCILVFSMMAVVDLSFEVVPKVRGATITVDDSGGADHTKIQDAIDDAQPGDTVYVYNGNYVEKITINKPISLIGESRDNTHIDGMSPSGEPTVIIYSSQVTINGFKIFGSGDGYPTLQINSNSNAISNNRILSGEIGINLNSVTGNVISSNVVNNCLSKGISLYNSNSNTVTSNSISIISYGIFVKSSSWNTITHNSVSQSGAGISFWNNCKGNNINDNTLSNNGDGIYFSDSDGNTAEDNKIQSNTNGVHCVDSENIKVINSTISNSGDYDFYLETWSGSESHVISINTLFDKSKTYFATYASSTLTVKWYLHINVIDYLGNPVPNANVKIEDNLNGSYGEVFPTDTNGYIRWIPVTEYIEQDTNLDRVGEKTDFTPHRILAWNDALVGYAYPNPILDQSKSITIVLNKGALLDIKPGWSLVSLPRPQSNTDIINVLQSIEGRYNKVQYYDVSDTQDHWKHFHVSKLPSMNDFNNINNSMGFWLHVTDSQGTTLVVFGDEPATNQIIGLQEGWNMVGYPSLTNHNRSVGLNNLDFGIDVDAIQWFNATSKTWYYLEEGDYFEIGRGYWIHATTNCVWEVPL
jgi:parallel beta-helix repeat protein